MLSNPVLKCNLRYFLFMLSKLPLVTPIIQQFLSSWLQEIQQCRPVNNGKRGIYYTCTKQLHFACAAVLFTQLQWKLRPARWLSPLWRNKHIEGRGSVSTQIILYQVCSEYRIAFFSKTPLCKSVWEYVFPYLFSFPVSLLLKILHT